MKKRNRALCSISAAMLMGSAHVAAVQAADNANDEGKIDEIVVTGLRASLEVAADIKKNADQVVDAIVADDIGKFPDNTVAAACNACRAFKRSTASTTRSSIR